MSKITRIFSRLQISSPLPIWSTSCRTVFFGPANLSGNNGKSCKAKRKFYAVRHLPPFVLHVRNGRQNGEFMLDSGELWLNDQMVLGPSDFAQGFRNREIKVELNDMNMLEIRAVDPSLPFEVTVWVEGLKRWNYQGFLSRS